MGAAALRGGRPGLRPLTHVHVEDASGGVVGVHGSLPYVRGPARRLTGRTPGRCLLIPAPRRLVAGPCRDGCQRVARRRTPWARAGPRPGPQSAPAWACRSAASVPPGRGCSPVCGRRCCRSDSRTSSCAEEPRGGPAPPGRSSVRGVRTPAAGGRRGTAVTWLRRRPARPGDAEGPRGRACSRRTTGTRPRPGPWRTRRRLRAGPAGYPGRSGRKSSRDPGRPRACPAPVRLSRPGSSCLRLTVS